MSKVRVVSQEDYDKWLISESEVGSLTMAQQGAKLFQTRACASCHSVDSPAVKVGPSLYQKWGKEEEFDDGTKGLVDENYVRESILLPQAKIVKGYPRPSPMPSFQGQLSEKQLSALVEYIKSLQ